MQANDIAVDGVIRFDNNLYLSVTNRISLHRTRGSRTSTFLHDNLPGHMNVLWPHDKPEDWFNRSEFMWLRDKDQQSQLWKQVRSLLPRSSPEAATQRQPPPPDVPEKMTNDIVDAVASFLVAENNTEDTWFWKEKPILRHNCDHCGKRGRQFKRCARCKVVHYCSLECQRANWKEHKKYCSDQ